MPHIYVASVVRSSTIVSDFDAYLTVTSMKKRARERERKEEL
jgi:hypothetical protein